MSTNKITTPGQLVAVTDAQGAGVITYWKLQGNTDQAVLESEWPLSANKLPSVPGLEPALRQALFSIAKALSTTLKRFLVSPLSSKGAWGLVMQTLEDGDVLDHAQVGEWRIVDGAIKSSTTYQPGIDWVAVTEQIKDQAYQNIALNADIMSRWLSRVVYEADAVRIRDGGGVYFVPSGAALDKWRAMSKAVLAASLHTIYEIPAMNSDGAVKAVLDAIQAEADKESDSLENDLDAARAGKPGYSAKVLARRDHHAEAVEAKLERYEQLLGVYMDGAKERLARIRAAMATHMLMLSGDDQ